MSRVSYINGSYCPHKFATTHIEDRGYQFADGVYEVIAVHNKKLLDFDDHIKRLLLSLNKVKINHVYNAKMIKFISNQLIKKNYVNNGIIYLQVTRGITSRNHSYPNSIKPVLVMTAKNITKNSFSNVEKGVKVISLPDLRWSRCDIKSISLLANVLAKQEAVELGAFEAIFYDRSNFITEGSSSNIWIVDNKNIIKTPPLSNKILAGVTRKVLKRLVKENLISFIESKISIDDIKKSNEVFITNTTGLICPVIQMDNRLIANGLPGPITLKLIDLFAKYSKSI